MINIISKNLSYILLYIVAILLQVFVIDSKNLFGVTPSIIVAVVIVSSLLNDIKISTIYNLLMGLFLDFLYKNEFGIYTLGFVIISVIIGFINKNYRKESKLSLIYITFLGTCIFEIYKYLVYTIILSSTISIFFLIFQIIISFILNVVITFIIYNVFFKIHDITEIEKEYTLR